ncbi:Do/DeqQ family serine protease [Flavobacteriaceae bacterium MAR_2010_188]|nr:Do/DeqQ family serine protease [Flavobacteriaceae bacterium MAR_2010_188]
MKKIFILVLVSILGGIMALTSYKLIEKNDRIALSSSEQNPPTFIPASYNATEAKFSPDALPNFVVAAEKSIDAVVHVKNTAVRNSPNSLEDYIYGRSTPRQQIGTGSGVIISPDGMIITNNHVIAGAQSLSITTNDNHIYEAELIGTDPKTDIALLKINSDVELPFVRFGDSDNARVGEWVLAVGNPFNLTSTVTAGIISAKSRDLSGESKQSFIQTDAAVNPGNSGGALVNEHGDLIGINTAITSQTGSYIGYSFAVPSNIARKVVEDIIEFGSVQNGILGVAGGTLNSEASKEYGINTTEGFYVNTVEDGSGAYKAGIKTGDVITKLDQIKISKFADMKGYLSTKRPDDVINVTILRDGDYKTLPVKLVKNSIVILPIIGTVKNAEKADLNKYKVNHGIKISSIDPTYRKAWAKNGINEGSIITSINDIEVNDVEEAKKIIENKEADEPLKYEVINNRGVKETYYWR